MAVENAQEATVIAVGQLSPFPPPPFGEMSVAFTLAWGAAVMLVNLPEITADDIRGINSPPHAVALYQSDALPAGALVLLLRTSPTDVWPICAPILDDEKVMRAWAGNAVESNVLLLVLVDAVSRIVRAQRTIGLPIRLFEMIQAGIRRTPGIDFDASMQAFAAQTDLSMWDQGTQWKDTDSSGMFSLVKEQVRVR